VYYSRYSLNGKPKWHSLRTNVFEQAKIKHKRFMLDIEKARKNRVEVSADFRTLGGLFGEMQRRLGQKPGKPNTEVGRAYKLARLKQHWVAGNFETFPVQKVNEDLILKLRDHLLHDAKWTRVACRGNVN